MPEDGTQKEPCELTPLNYTPQTTRKRLQELDSSIQAAWKSRDEELSRALHLQKDQLLATVRNPLNSQTYDSAGAARLGNGSVHTSIPINQSDSSSSIDSKGGETIDLEFPVERHKSLGDFVKSLIYGGLDGIITTFAVVAGVQGADLKPAVILVLGFANLVADGLAMGIGDYLSEKAQNDFAISERVREAWEFKTFQESEINEMVDIYHSKHGLSKSDARSILVIMAKYPDFFVDHMMVEELGLNPPDPDANPAINGFYTLIAFMSFGAVPLLSYLISAIAQWNDKDAAFLISVALTIACLGLLGTFKAKLTESSYLHSIATTVINGSIAAAASFFIGHWLSQLVDAKQC